MSSSDARPAIKLDRPYYKSRACACNGKRYFLFRLLGTLRLHVWFECRIRGARASPLVTVPVWLSSHAQCTVERAGPAPLQAPVHELQQRPPAGLVIMNGGNRHASLSGMIPTWLPSLEPQRRVRALKAEQSGRSPGVNRPRIDTGPPGSHRVHTVSRGAPDHSGCVVVCAVAGHSSPSILFVTASCHVLPENPK